MSNEIFGWHFVREDGTTNYLKQREQVGQTYRIEGEIVPCENGLHFSVRALDALGYAPGWMVRRVRCAGTVVMENDKGACSERTVLAEANAKAVLLEFAADCAERALPHFESKFPNDNRPRKAIETLRAFIRGEATIEDLKAAYAPADAAARAAARAGARAAAYAAAHAADAAARAAAYAPARAAAHAAYAAADAAARAAADAAARAAAHAAYAAADAAHAAYAAYAAAYAAARAAAHAAERDWQNTELEKRLLALLTENGYTEEAAA